jgi:uncharacterized protein YcfL
MKKILIVPLISVLLVTCTPIISLKINGEDEKVISTQCYQVSLRAYKKSSNPGYLITARFKSNTPVDIQLSELRLFYQHRSLPLEFRNNQGNAVQGNLMLADDEQIFIGTTEDFLESDTLMLELGQGLVCLGEPIYKEPLKISLRPHHIGRRRAK